MSDTNEQFSGGPLHIFFAYAHTDAPWYEKIEKQLVVLSRLSWITLWPQQQIPPGQETSSKLNNDINAAHIILLLISAEFIADKQTSSILSQAMERSMAGKARVVPILLSPPVGWKLLPCAKLASLPSNRRPIAKWTAKDAALDNICTGIQVVVEEMRKTAHEPRTDSWITSEELPPACPPGTHLQRLTCVEELYAQLLPSENNSLVLTGMGGSGKTVLSALLYHYIEQQQISGSTPFAGKMIWLTIQESTTLVDIVRIVRTALGESALDFQRLTAREMARELFRSLNNTKRAHVIFLNQFDALIDPQTQRPREDRPGIAEWLDLLNSQPCASRVILTCRYFSWEMLSSHASYLQTFPVPELTEEEGAYLLRLWKVEAREDELRLAVRRCQGHVLALGLLHGLLQNAAVRLIDFFNASFAEQERIDMIARKLLNYIFTHQLDQGQRNLLLAFSIFREAAPLEAAQAIIEEHHEMTLQQLIAARRALLNHSLLSPSSHLLYQLHSLVAEFAREHFVERDVQANQQALRAAHARAAYYYARIKGPSHDQRHNRGDIHHLIEATWHFCQAGLYQAAYDLIVQEHLFPDLKRWGENSTLLELYLCLLPSDRWQAPPEQAARILNEIGEIYQTLGQRQQARTSFEQALHLFRTANAPGGMVDALNNVGSMLRREGQLEEALRCYDEARSLFEQTHAEIPGKSVTLNNIGYIYYERGKRQSKQSQKKPEFEEARRYYEEALALHQAAMKPEEEARTLANLGTVSRALGDTMEAYNYYRQALTRAREIGDRWVEALVLNDLGEFFREDRQQEFGGAEQRMQVALEHYGQAWHIFRAIGAREDESKVLKNIGYLHLFQPKEIWRPDMILACFMLARDILNELHIHEHKEIPHWIMTEVKLEVGQQRLHELIEEANHQTEQIIKDILR